MSSVAIKSRSLISLYSYTLFILAYSLKFISASNVAIKDGFIFSFVLNAALVTKLVTDGKVFENGDGNGDDTGDGKGDEKLFHIGTFICHSLF